MIDNKEYFLPIQLMSVAHDKTSSYIDVGTFFYDKDTKKLFKVFNK